MQSTLSTYMGRFVDRIDPADGKRVYRGPFVSAVRPRIGGDVARFQQAENRLGRREVELA
jgi:hypothetical protein